jgi:hypothetical protein
MPGTVLTTFDVAIVVVPEMVEVTIVVIVRGGTFAIANSFALYAAALIGVGAEREALLPSMAEVEEVLSDCPTLPKTLYVPRNILVRNAL